MNPSADCAHFRVMNGRWSVCDLKNIWLSRRDSSASTPVITSAPASRSMAMPRPLTLGLGSPAPTTTRGIPVSISNLAQGGVFPKCEHGSSVTYMVDCLINGLSASLTDATALTSACPSPQRRCHPSPITLPSGATITAPTMGLGTVNPRPLAASCRARLIYFSSKFIGFAYIYKR